MNDFLNEQGQLAAADTALDASTLNVAAEAVIDESIDAVAVEQKAVEEQPNGFVELGLAPELVQAVADLGYTQPTAVQKKAIPLAMGEGADENGFIDLLVSSQTGSGKTAAFLLPVLNTILQQRAVADAEAKAEFDRLCAEAAAKGEPLPKRAKRKDPTNPRNFKAAVPGALILCPTRELADQVATEIRRLARAQENIKVVTVYGGVPTRNQIASLENGAHIVVGTPGRVMDLIDRGVLDISNIQTLVLDEADRMLDMGFYADITTVVEQCPEQRQTLLFSATYPDDIDRLAKRFMREPQMVQVAAQHSAHKIEQRWYEVPAKQKVDVVVQMLAHFRPESSIVFCNTKQQCRDVVTELQAQGISALALFGELEQRERDEVLVQFANRSCSVLVATDVAARGLDIANLACVINVDVTPDAEVHIHRIGRTGRGDAEGLALNLVAMDEMPYVAKIEQLQGRPSEWLEVAELTPKTTNVVLRKATAAATNIYNIVSSVRSVKETAVTTPP
nr:DEAD/DEAH box helicase [Comamonas jiangduensis]